MPSITEVCQCPVPPAPVLASPLVTPWFGLSHQGAASACSVWIDGSVLVVPLSSLDLTVDDLLKAHHQLCQRDSLVCFDCADGMVASLDSNLNGRCFAFCPSDLLASPDVAPIEVSPTLSWTEDPVGSTLSVVMPEPVSASAPLASDVAPMPGMPTEAPFCGPRELPIAQTSKRARVGEEQVPALAGTFADPLVTLTSTELFQLDCPQIHDAISFLALRHAKIRSRERLAVLEHQQFLWADDELMWQLSKLTETCPPGEWAILDILLATQVVVSGSRGLINSWYRDLGFSPKHIVSVVHLEGHWIPCVWSPHPNGMSIRSWDVPGSPDRRLNVLHQSLANASGSRTFTWNHSSHAFDSSGLCGPCALSFLRHVFTDEPLIATRDEAGALHRAARREFCDFAQFCFQVPRPWRWGAGLDVKADERLRTLLKEHGVPGDAIDSRVHLILQAFDRQKLQHALTSAQPWRSLKAQANQLQPKFQLVLAHELDAVVQTKAMKGVGKGRRRKGLGDVPTPSRAVPPPEIDPNKLMVEDGSFVSANGHALKQVQLAKVGPFCEGVVLVTLPEVQAYLKAGHVVSSGALGFLLLNAENTLMDTKLSWSSIRIVARCQANGEPMILPAVLVQLGKLLVGQKQSQSACVIPSVEAACLKVSVYRDMVAVPWEDIVASPVRFVLTQLAPLTKCTCEAMTVCESPCWHPTEADEVQDPVLDVWRKQWVSSTFRPAAPQAADIFMLNIRYLGSLEEKLLPYSGLGGVFLEPRSLCARHPVMDYQVLWLGKSDLSELQRLRSCHPAILGLARMGSRLGVRVATVDAADAAKTLKPGSIFLASGSRATFEVGPLPYGTDRLAVAKVCAQHGWQARPLHVSRSVDQLGVMWLLQACTSPPAAVIPYKGGELVITKLPDKHVENPSDKTAIIGASETLQLCAKTASFEQSHPQQPKPDPWATYDPWKSASHSGTPPEPASLDAIADRLEKKVRAKLPKDMEVDSDHHAHVEARFAALEQQVQSLTVNQQSLSSQIGSVETRVTQTMDHQGKEIQAMFQQQMTQIERLLSQRSWWGGRSPLTSAEVCRERDLHFQSQPLSWFIPWIFTLVMCCLGLSILGFGAARCLLFWVWDVLITSVFRFCFDWLTSCRLVTPLVFGLSLSCLSILCFAMPWRFRFVLADTWHVRFRCVSCPSWVRIPVWLLTSFCVRLGAACVGSCRVSLTRRRFALLSVIGFALSLFSSRSFWTFSVMRDMRGDENCYLGLFLIALVPPLFRYLNGNTWLQPGLLGARQVYRCHRVAWWIALLSSVRFGEACHPGPSWTLGLCNINGLSSKVGFFQDVVCDTWLLCETHLTAPGKRSFAHALRGLQSPYVNLVHGHPVMPRSEASDVGQWTGVGVVSTCPLRSLPHSWPDHVYKCSRLVCTASLHHHVWVSGCVIYGPPGGPTHPKARETTDHLVQLCIDRMLQSVGPRYIAGDLNHDLERLKTSEQLAKLGFRDIQDVHAAKTGVWPCATCRGKTRRDFLFMSPELCDLFLHCEVKDNEWSDHSCLIAHFRGGSDALLRFPWSKPDPMTWMPQRQSFDMPQFVDPAQVNADYRLFWSQVEESNFCAQIKAGLPVVRACSGRGRTTKPHKRLHQLAPVKSGRAGDRVPEFFGSNLQHVQWTKQSRRLLSFVRLASAPASPNHLAHRDQLWTSILLAPGFVPTFSGWWAHRELRHGEPLQVPCAPPSPELARLIQLGLDFELSQLEKALRHARNHARKLHRTSEVGAIYRDVKRDPPVQVDSLLQSLSATVVAVHADDCSVSVDPPCLWWSRPCNWNSGHL